LGAHANPQPYHQPLALPLALALTLTLTPTQAHWELKRPEWLDDMIPEIMDGKNIADFVDPDIEKRSPEP
jgi:hypothetical protein